MKPSLRSVARLTAGAAAVVGIALVATACATPAPPPASSPQPSYRIEVHPLPPTHRAVGSPTPAPSAGSREYAQRMLRDAQSRLSGCQAIAEHDGTGDDACADVAGTVQVWQDAVDGKGYPAAWAD